MLPLPAHVTASGGKPFRLTHGAITVGASPDVDYVVRESTVSRRHLSLQLVPEGVRIIDLGSTNGTYFQGNRIREMILSTKGELRLGKARLDIDFELPPLVSTQCAYGALKGAAPCMRDLYGRLRRLEGSVVGVLLLGESGTGKELIAREVHKHSAVGRGPLVTVNCGALAREFVRSELFGHCKGAFTGATENRVGAFVRASGGTLFLDEVGELPLDVQPMLLRALQEREVSPLGADRPSRVNVRVIAATHRNLRELVDRGLFREDLYFRLKVVQLEVPALRDRREDIRLLATDLATRHGIAELCEDVVGRLESHDWPGNVRELANAIEGFAAIGELPEWERSSVEPNASQLADSVSVEQPYEVAKQAFVEQFRATYLRKLLALTGGNVSRASKLSGLERSYLNRLVLRHELR